jgi:hypothetical protein
MLAEECETDGSLYVVTYCPDCYLREFGEIGHAAESDAELGRAGNQSGRAPLP